MSELKIMNLAYFIFLSYFLILDLELGYSMMSHMTVTNLSHVIVT